MCGLEKRFHDWYNGNVITKVETQRAVLVEEEEEEMLLLYSESNQIHEEFKSITYLFEVDWLQSFEQSKTHIWESIVKRKLNPEARIGRQTGLQG